eukprot:13207093-Alexandrium_andersonii.AAC.1
MVGRQLPPVPGTLGGGFGFGFCPPVLPPPEPLGPALGKLGSKTPPVPSSVGGSASGSSLSWMERRRGPDSGMIKWPFCW